MSDKRLLPAMTMSFLELIDRYMILIPVIQRDYAQGRQTEDVIKIREDFVHDLLCFIKDSTQPHYVDFVYGTVEYKNGHKDAFIPLDGQQRLTTLFLLHLYIAEISGNYQSFYDKTIDRFEYSTRKSSTEFCRGLISHNVCGDLIEKREDEPNVKLSAVIENQGWFFSAWKQDPTVQGMLVMLDEIDCQVQKQKDLIPAFYDNLFKGEVQPIVYQWQPLEGYTLTDDLYIKMNARGLKLTDFEVFKALYEMSLNCVSPELKNQFENKIDGEWCDFLWQRKGELKSTDIIMERILRLMFAYGFAGQESKDKDIQTKLDKLFARNKQYVQFSYSRYRELGIFHDTHKKVEEISQVDKEKENLIAKRVVEAFNIICDKENSPLLKQYNCTPWCDEKGLFFKILNNPLEDLTYDDFIYFYSFISFFSRYKGNINIELNQWLRYIFNLSNATIINDSVQLSRTIRSIDNILESIGNKEVLKWISENSTVAAFSTNQAYEESVKAKLILWGEDNNNQETRWRKYIYQNEQDAYMRGQIGFLLEIAGVYSVDIDNFDSEQSNKAIDILYDCSEKARALFSHFEKIDEITTNHLIERALLTKGMYLKYASVGRLNFCNHPYDRDNSLRKMLEITPGQNNHSVDVMKKLLTDTWIDNKDAIKSLNEIVAVYLKNGNDSSMWYAPFLGQFGAELIDICHQGYIQKNNNYITLLHESQMNHYHSEIQSRMLHFELKPQYQFIHYCSVRSSEENPGVYFKLKVNDRILSIYFYYYDGWHLEVYDEQMYNYMIDVPEWDKYSGELSNILNIEVCDKSISINRETINSILNSLNTNNKELIAS